MLSLLRAKSPLPDFKTQRAQEIVFTRNATEAINLVARTWGAANIELPGHSWDETSCPFWLGSFFSLCRWVLRDLCPFLGSTVAREFGGPFSGVSALEGGPPQPFLQATAGIPN